MNFTISKRASALSMALIGLGAIATIVGVIGDHSDHHQRAWSALLVNGFFFLGIGLGALFFYALQNATETAWSVLVKRLFEAVLGWIPVGAVVLIVVLAAGSMGLHHIYHWMDASLYDPASPNFDAVMAGKQMFFRMPFYWLRTLAYLAPSSCSRAGSARRAWRWTASPARASCARTCSRTGEARSSWSCSPCSAAPCPGTGS